MFSKILPHSVFGVYAFTSLAGVLRHIEWTRYAHSFNVPRTTCSPVVDLYLSCIFFSFFYSKRLAALEEHVHTAGGRRGKRLDGQTNPLKIKGLNLPNVSASSVGRGIRMSRRSKTAGESRPHDMTHCASSRTQGVSTPYLAAFRRLVI